MCICSVFTPVFQCCKQLIFHAQLRFFSSPSVLFCIAFLQYFYHFMECCSLYSCDSPELMIIVFFDNFISLLYHISFYFARGLLFFKILLISSGYACFEGMFTSYHIYSKFPILRHFIRLNIHVFSPETIVFHEINGIIMEYFSGISR